MSILEQYDIEYISKNIDTTKEIYNYKYNNCVSTIYNIIKKYKFKSLNESILINNNEEKIYLLYISFFIILFYSNKKNNNEFESTNYELLWYIEKNINNILIWNNVFNNIKTNFSDKNIKNTVFKIITLLEKELFFKIRKIKKNNKTIKILSYDSPNTYENDFKVNVNEYKYFKYENKYYLYINHFINILEVCKINESSGYYINLYDDTLLKKIIKNSIKIDWSLYLNLLNITIENYGFNSIEECIEKFNYIKIKKEYLNNKILYEKLDWIILHYNFYIKYNKYEHIYFSFSFDFRGRLYADHSCSYTNSKILRNCIIIKQINYNEYKPDLINSKTDLILSKYIHLIKENVNDDIKFLLIWILISIGKIFKDKNKKKISIEEFITLGINNLNSDSKNLKLEDIYEFIKYKKIYKEILENKTNNLYTISKDATASGIQHLIRILGEKNEKSFIYTNMNSELYWYDTYSYIIDSFFIKNNIPNEYKEIFNRKTLKKTIMIENYGATYSKCLNDFLKSINIINKNFSLIIIKECFKLFFNDLRKNNDNNIFFNNIDIYDEKNLEFNLLDSIINLTYYKINKKQYSVIINKNRNTIQLNYFGKINNKKSKSSHKANLTHSFDSEIVRRMILLNKNPIFSIHDCFIIPITDISLFIDILNNQMKKSSIIDKKNILFDIYSLFIIL